MGFGSAVIAPIYLFLKPDVKVNEHNQRIADLEAIIIKMKAKLAGPLSGPNVSRETAQRELDGLTVEWQKLWGRNDGKDDEPGSKPQRSP
jgi:hypothetical protein